MSMLAPVFATLLLLLAPLPGGWLGIMLDDLAARPTIAEVVPGSPAELAGLRVGDVVTAVAGTAIGDVEALVREIGKHDVDAEIKIVVQRDGREVKVRATLRKRPENGAIPARREARDAPAPGGETGIAPRGQVGPADLATSLAAVRRSGKPGLLVFGASWCASCQALDRAFGVPEVARALSGYEIVRLDTDRHGEAANRYGVQGIPHLVVVAADGKPRATLTGFHPPDRLVDFLRSHRGAPPRARDDSPRVVLAELRALRAEIAELRALLRELDR